MQHRHLDHQRLTLAAIDDVIARGGLTDWIALRQAARNDPVIMEKVRHVCLAKIADPYAQRYHFWMHYAKEHAA